MVTDRVGPTITTLKAEVDFLSAELAAAKAEIERLREWNAEIALNAREFVADNERLRAVVEKVYQSSNQPHIIEMTRAALEGKDE